MSQDTGHSSIEDDDSGRDERLVSIGRRVAEARERLGWSQKQLAAHIDRAVNSVSRWETGSQQMGILDALAIAAALKVPVQQLLDPMPGVERIREQTLYFVSQERIKRLRLAKNNDDLIGLLGMSPQVGVAIDPSDLQVSEADWKAYVRDANKILTERATGWLAQLLRRPHPAD